MPGDIVVIEAGDVVSADLRVLDASKLQCDESPLTGESMPVSKSATVLAPTALLQDRKNMLYKGCSITRGTGLGIVVGTGMQTELGEITELISESSDDSTPIEMHLDWLGKRLIGIILFLVVFISSVGVFRGKDLWVMVETGIALAVASIPEGLPIVATLALSRGMLRMAKKNALVRRLHSVETLGCASVICTDKTGTLTENKMTVTRFASENGAYERSPSGIWESGAGVSNDSDATLKLAIQVAVLCNNAFQGDEGHSGDPMETALLGWAGEFGVDVVRCRNEFPEEREVAFESESKMMATFHASQGLYFVAVKGAPEALLGHCALEHCDNAERTLTEERRSMLREVNSSVASAGYRVLAFAYRYAQSVDENPYDALVWLGMAGFIDPPRSDIRSTIEECRHAGIRIVILTGDQKETAEYVAREVGLGEETIESIPGDALSGASSNSEEETARLLRANLFYRVTPKQKLELIELHQQAGNVVAMTGDGVNDAPALKTADIGVAMGRRGTQVAQEVADVVLKDDAFKTIVYAVREGRVIYGNIRKFVLYLLSCNVAEILVIFLAALVTSKLPILPLQILFLNFVTDVFPAFALGAGEGGEGIMDRPPRPKKEPILTNRHWFEIAFYGASISVATLAVYLIARQYWASTYSESVTMAFLTLALAQLWHVFNMREPGSTLWRNQVVANPWVWLAIALCSGLLVLSVYLPPLTRILGTTPISGSAWLMVLAASVVPVVADEVLRRFYVVQNR